MQLIPLDEDHVLVQHQFQNDKKIGSFVLVTYTPKGFVARLSVYLKRWKIAVPEMALTMNDKSVKLEVDRIDDRSFKAYAKLEKGIGVVSVIMSSTLVNKNMDFNLNIKHIYQ